MTIDARIQEMMQEKFCKWRLVNNGMSGFDDYEWETSCDKSFDSTKILKLNYCPHCGGKIIS